METPGLKVKTTLHITVFDDGTVDLVGMAMTEPRETLQITQVSPERALEEIALLIGRSC